MWPHKRTNQYNVCSSELRFGGKLKARGAAAYMTLAGLPAECVPMLQVHLPETRRTANNWGNSQPGQRNRQPIRCRKKLKSVFGGKMVPPLNAGVYISSKLCAFMCERETYSTLAPWMRRVFEMRGGTADILAFHKMLCMRASDGILCASEFRLSLSRFEC